MAGAVAIRCGLIPLHVWSARFMEGVSPLAIPAAFAWGSAAFVLAALDWGQVALGPTAAGEVERLLIVALAMVSIVLGGLAAMVHDDIEHVLGYSILQDAGVAVLAFASLEPEAVAAARNWLVASATVKTALAAWAAVVRSTYGGHRLADLGGWARHAPALGVGFGVILIAAIGLPGMSLFEARATLVGSAMPGIGVVGRARWSRRCPRSTSVVSRSRGWRRSAPRWRQGLRAGRGGPADARPAGPRARCAPPCARYRARSAPTASRSRRWA